MKKEIKHFEEMQLENLAKIKGGTIFSMQNANTDPSPVYPNGDNVDVTQWSTGKSKQDGIGGGTCPIAAM